MESELVCDSRLMKALASVDAWDNEEPLVLVNEDLDSLIENACIVMDHFLDNEQGQINRMNMCAMFEYRFGVML